MKVNTIKFRIPLLPLLLLLVLMITFACGKEKSNESAQEEVVRVPAAAERDTRTPTTLAPAELVEEEPVAADDAVDLIAEIRSDYANIRKQLDEGSLRKDTIKYECENDPGGGILTRYYDQEELVMITLEQYSEHLYDQQTFYLKDGQPFFVFREEGYWRFGGPLNEEAPNTVDEITETRNYLHEGKIIRQLTKSYENKSWEDAPESNEIPNEEVEEAKGTPFPLMPAIPQLMAGNAGC